MRPYMIVLALGTVLVTGLYSENWPAVRIPEIEQYYNDINYVATHSAPSEQTTMAAYLSGKRFDDSFLKDRRLRPVYERLKSIMKIRLSSDPGINKGPFGYDADCSSTVEPIELISRSNDRVVIRVLRENVGTMYTELGVISLLKRLFHRSPSQGWTFDEIDTWFLIDNKWRLNVAHMYLLGNSPFILPSVEADPGRPA